MDFGIIFAFASCIALYIKRNENRIEPPNNIPNDSLSHAITLRDDEELRQFINAKIRDTFYYNFDEIGEKILNFLQQLSPSKMTELCNKIVKSENTEEFLLFAKQEIENTTIDDGGEEILSWLRTINEQIISYRKIDTNVTTNVIYNYLHNDAYKDKPSGYFDHNVYEKAVLIFNHEALGYLQENFTKLRSVSRPKHDEKEEEMVPLIPKAASSKSTASSVVNNGHEMV